MEGVPLRNFSQHNVPSPFLSNAEKGKIEVHKVTAGENDE